MSNSARSRKKRPNTNTHSEDRIDQMRIPPQSIDAEQSVLGAIMLRPEAFDIVVDIVAVTDFYRRDHQLIYQAIKDLADQHKPYDAVTMGEWFNSQGFGHLVENGAYLGQLVSNTPSAANVVAYATIVAEKATLRRLIEVGTDIVNDSFEPEGRECSDIVSAAEQAVLAVAESGAQGRSNYVMMPEVLTRVFDIVQQRYSNGTGISGESTHYPELDEMTSGLQPTDLIILAARPSMGKTTLAINIAENVAILGGKAVGVFSMEMSAEQLGLKLVSSIGKVNATRLRSGQLEDEDWSHMSVAIRTLKGSKILIDDTPSLSPEALRAKARRMKREHDIGLVVVDYLQLMQVPGSAENRATEISEISRQLKALAKELRVPVIALSQLNRSLETRADKRPVMADLRESGAIEQDADLIMFIYRDEYYNKESSPDKGIAEVIIAKQRTGPTGVVRLGFRGEVSRFESLRNQNTFEA